MATITQLQEAQDALHKLAMGKQVVSVMYDGRRIEFQPTDINRLESHIAKLQAELGTSSRRSGPCGVSF